MSHEFGNASSFHKKGQASRNAVESAREIIADFLETEPGDILFTSGGTEGNNLAVKGALEALSGKKNHLVVSSIEHQSVLHPAQALQKKGIPVSIVPVDSNGVIILSELEKAITDQTALVSVMHVNNETGMIQPIEEASRLAHQKGALFHTDCVQSFGKIKIDLDLVRPDMITISSHKICGPKGVGALYLKKGIKIKAVTHGGHQEKNIRPGTENVASIAGFGKAVELVREKSVVEVKRVKLLRDKLIEGIRKNISKIQLNGNLEGMVYNTANISFDGLDGETLLMNLDLKNIYVSTGSACTAGSVESSHVLLAMGLSEKMVRSTIRFSLGRYTTDAEIDACLNELPPIVERLRKNATHAS